MIYDETGLDQAEKKPYPSYSYHIMRVLNMQRTVSIFFRARIPKTPSLLSRASPERKATGLKSKGSGRSFSMTASSNREASP
jgi:hypothetical protein